MGQFNINLVVIKVSKKYYNIMILTYGSYYGSDLGSFYDCYMFILTNYAFCHRHLSERGFMDRSLTTRFENG